MRRLLVSVFVLSSICSTAAPRLAGAPSDPLDNDSIIQMVKWNLTDSEIIGDIRRSQTNFDLSPSTISILTANGISEAVLNAMFIASKRSSKTVDGGSEGIRPENRKSTTPPVPTPPTTTPPAPTPPTTTPPPSTPPPVNAPPAAVTPAHTPQRLAEATGATAVTPPICDGRTSSTCVPPYHVPCPLTNTGKTPDQTISLYFISATSDPTRVDDSGAFCFEIHDFNDILYTASFQVTETAPTGSALDYLQDAIKTLTGLSFGGATTDSTAAATKTAANAQKGVTPPNGSVQCPTALITAITTAQGAAGRFGAALSGIDPGKDSSGNVNLVDWRTTTFKWQPVPGTYQQFEAAVSQVIASLQLEDVDVCTDDVKAEAEAVVVDTYLPARDTYTFLASHVASDHVVRMTSQLHSTSAYTIAVQANYPSGNVVGGTKTFSLSAGRKILSSSGGFLVTGVPSPSYSSVTAPSGMTSPATQTVLAVNNRSGPTLGLVALLNVYLPNLSKEVPLNGHDWGLALAAGPTYNLSNGKADTSKFGLFAGVSLHIRSQLFLTPGVNIGEYSSWPIGFSAPGQIIPPNEGTPTGVSRWTTRFAFAITYKIKDFGQSTTATPVTPAPTPSATTPPTKSPTTN
jgi:hypothetical protein